MIKHLFHAEIVEISLLRRFNIDMIYGGIIAV